MGQGPIGLMFTMLVKRTGARVAATDTIAERRAIASRCGAEFTWDPKVRSDGTRADRPDVHDAGETDRRARGGDGHDRRAARDRVAMRSGVYLGPEGPIGWDKGRSA